MRTRSRIGRVAAAGLVLLALVHATTLQKLSLDDMIQQSTGIVRAKVTGSRAALRGQNIFTYYRLQVLEAPKRGDRELGQNKDVEVAVPGGMVDGIRQIAVGSPELTPGSEYVLFLWTGKSGLTQIIGLSQGLFRTSKDASGAVRLTRAAASEPMVNKSGRTVPDQALDLTWNELRSKIQKELKK